MWLITEVVGRPKDLIVASEGIGDARKLGNHPDVLERNSHPLAQIHEEKKVVPAKPVRPFQRVHVNGAQNLRALNQGDAHDRKDFENLQRVHQFARLLGLHV